MEQLSNDQVDLIVEKFLTLTNKELHIAGDKTIRYVSGRFGNTRISLKGSWSECEVSIENPQFDSIHGILFKSECPFDALKWLINRNYRAWVKVRNHAIKMVDQRTKTLSKIDEVLDKTFPDEVEKHLLGK